MNALGNFLLETLAILLLGNLCLLLVPRSIRKAFKFTFKSIYKTATFIISLSTRMVKFLYNNAQDLYIDKEKNNKKRVVKKQPSNVIQFPKNCAK